MSTAAAFRLLIAPLQPGERRMRDSIVTSERLTDHEAVHLLGRLRAQIRHDGLIAVEGPKIFRERVTRSGETEHVVTAIAIVRPAHESVRA